MKICYFWSADWPEARRLLAEHAPTAESVWTGGNHYDYWYSLLLRWGQDDLVTIEQDNGIHEEVIPQFMQCPEPWCSFGYQIGSYICYTGAGCRKLSLGLQKQFPVERLAYPVPDVGECPECAALCWRHIDTRVTELLLRNGYTPHMHHPDVRHLRMET